jgi:NTP pyrophosphatase (non-canonical NTP hydrolase)
MFTELVANPIEVDAIEMFREMTELCGSNSAAKGWHDDRPEGGVALANWQGNKLMLMVSEVVEAHDELRTGHAANETYYPTATGADLLHSEGPFKPEGVPSELADTVIRVFDFCYTEDIDLGAIIAEKLAYNRTRERMHGGKKF